MNKEPKKRLIFKNGCDTIRFPFMLTMFSPWQVQVELQAEKIQKGFEQRKSVRWGYEIDENGACITVRKINK